MYDHTSDCWMQRLKWYVLDSKKLRFESFSPIGGLYKQVEEDKK